MDASQRLGCFLTTTSTRGETITTTLREGAKLKTITKIRRVKSKTTISILTTCKTQLEIAGLGGVTSTTQLQTAK